MQEKRKLPDPFDFWLTVIFGLTLAFVFFVLFSNAEASTVQIEHLDYNNTDNNSPRCQNFTVENGFTLDFIRVFGNSDWSPTTANMFLYTGGCPESYGTGGTQSTSIDVTLGNTADFYFSDVTLNEGVYGFEIIKGEGNGYLYVWNGATPSSYYPNGGMCLPVGGGFYDCDGTLVDNDLKFQIWGSSGPGPSSISLLTPSTSTVADFRYWEVSYENTTTTAGNTRAIIFYTKNISGEPIYGDLSVTTSTTSKESFFITKQRVLDLDTEWIAYATLLLVPDTDPDNPIVLATSTDIYFTLNYTLTGGTLSPPTSTTSTYAMTCDPTSGTFSYSICYVMQYLFSPKTSDFDVFTETYDGIKNKPPFGYFGAIKTAIEGFSTSTTSTLSFPDLTALDSDLFDKIKTTLTIILWVAFGFWIFNKFRNIQL